MKQSSLMAAGVCATGLLGVTGSGALHAQTVAYNTAYTPINGTGNATTGWSVYTDATLNLQLAFMAEYNYGSYIGAATNGPLTPNNGSGTYLFAPGYNPNSATKSVWNYWFSVNVDPNGTGGTLASSAYTFDIAYEAPGATSYTTVAISSYGDNSYGNNSTPANGGTVGTYAAESGTFNIMQNSENIGFIGGDPNAQGDWNFKLTALNGATQVGELDGTVQVGAVPEPNTIALAGLGGIAFLMLLRRRK